jgi:hypothetical protein
MEPGDHGRDMEQLYELLEKATPVPPGFSATVVFYWRERNDETEEDYDVNFIYRLETEAPWLDLNLIKDKLLKHAEEVGANIIDESLEVVSEELDFTYKFIKLVNTKPDESPMEPPHVDMWIEF